MHFLSPDSIAAAPAAPLQGFQSHSAHWGAFKARFDGQDLDFVPHPGDPAPSPILGNFRGVLRHRARILRPAVRRSWLEKGPGARRRPLDEPFVELGWDEALDLLASELRRLKDGPGPEAIYGGSYGWSSAGRFHHAQSQIHRFLNMALGGYVRSVNSYSAGASSVILPHVMGAFEDISRHNVTWDQICTHTDVVLAFGGMAIKNSMIGNGGVSSHIEPAAMRAAAARGTVFHLFSPLRDDLPADIAVRWHTPRVGTDTAVMLAMAHTLIAEGLHDRAFVERYCAGFEPYAAYLMGTADGVAKDAEWAARISGLPAGTIREIARSLVAGRSLITVSHSMQRAEYGEQPVWAAAALAALVGQMGLPGGGFNYALGAMGHTGRRSVSVNIPLFEQGRNLVEAFIPVARISDMLLHPGEAYDYNGRRLTYPDIRMVYWAGGNPFHHHQDLNRLQDAFARPETIVVHENAWTGMAKSADIVLPATMTPERDDIGATRTDPLMIAMRQLAPPAGEARDDYEIFAALAQRLGAAEAFTEGRSSAEWLRHLYEPTRLSLLDKGLPAPSFDEFWDAGELCLPLAEDDGGFLRRFREDPDLHRLRTPSGRIELFSETIAGFAYDDCPGHPAYIPARQQPDLRHPLHLIANAPATRLHSQLDFGSYSQSQKLKGREVLRMHPDDARKLGICDGDIVRVSNDLGATLAAAKLTDSVMRGVVNLPTGAWYDPVEVRPGEPPDCIHGNPNTLTLDIGTSRLAQGCCGQVAIVACERFDGEPPAIRAFDPPQFASR